MARKSQRDTVFSVLQQSLQPLSVADILRFTREKIPPRTLRRWLYDWVADGVLERSGTGRATRYQAMASPTVGTPSVSQPLGFLSGLDDDLKTDLLAQIRDLWTHTSTALEGNSFTLGDTHFVLQEGLTISGKPLKDHQEVIGHARAIDLLYRCLNETISEDIVFELHKAVQTEIVTDIYKPNGVWKVEPNSTHMIGPDGRQVHIEYALPTDVPVLMNELIEFLNALDTGNITSAVAHDYYAKIHAGVVHIHPFWDGNGRIARLLANIPLLRAGLPPLTVPHEKRRTYLQLLANYQIAIGQLNSRTGVWPDTSQLSELSQFCDRCYAATRNLVLATYEVQKRRRSAAC